jgi:phasin
MKTEVNANPRNTDAGEKRGFDPLFAVPGIFRGLAEQGAARAREGCEKMKAASGEIADILRETYSANAKGAADYRATVVEISCANTNSAFDFLTRLMDARSLSEVINLSTTQSRKTVEAVSAQNGDLWQLTRKVTAESAEPIKNGFTRILQKTS